MAGYRYQALLNDDSETHEMTAQGTPDNTTESTLPELRIVLLGKTGSGKSSAGNTILGRKFFKVAASPESFTKRCNVGKAEDNGMIIIDTPGLFDTTMTEEEMKAEIVRCIEKSVPGPHVFLLVIGVGRFTKEEKETVKWIQENFGKEADLYTIILFTHEDQLDEKPLKDYISESKDLQALVGECGGRFHSFNNKDMKNRSQVNELMKKIEEMVKENGGEHYTNEMYKEAQRKKDETEKQKEKFWSQKPRIVLLGKTGSGKSSVGNTILRKGAFKSRNLATPASKTCKIHKVAGNSIKIIDTPGLTDAPKEKLKAEVKKCVEMSAPGPHVFLLVISLNRFTDEEKNSIKWIQENFGEEAAHYTIVLFTHADQLKRKPLDEYIRESNDLQAFVDKYRGRFHTINNKKMRNRSQVTKLMKKIEKMLKVNGGKYYTNKTDQTSQRNEFLSDSSELRIVLLGKTGSGKSSTGNTILNLKNFETNESTVSFTKTCKIMKLERNEKMISVIDTPGLFDKTISEEKMKHEIVKCISISVPGPHAFLVVIRVGRFTDKKMNPVKWIQQNFGEKAALHTIILFTHDDKLKWKPLDEYIRENHVLKDLVDECGGRFHSFNNKDVENHSQVNELMEKIEEMLNENGGQCYSNEMYEEAQRKKPISSDSSELRIVLVGKTGSGKSSAGNIILGQECFEEDVSSITKTCESAEMKTSDRIISVIDTPGLFDLTMKSKIAKCIQMSVPGPHVFLLVIRVEGFKEEEKNSLKWIQVNFGEEASHYTIILFTHSDHLMGKPLEEFIRENNDLRALVDECGGRFHSFNNKDIENLTQVSELMDKIGLMVKENEWRYNNDEMYQEARKKNNFSSRNLRLVLLGTEGSGKTCAVETIVGKESFTKTCKKQEACVGEKKMKIIDTPGLIEAPKKKMQYLIENLVFKMNPGPHVFLLVIRLNETFTDEQKTANWFQKYIGGDAVRHTIIVFTHADQLSKSLEEYIRERECLQSLIQRCGGRYHMFNNLNENDQTQVTRLLEKIDKMAEQNSWKYYTNEMFKNILDKYNFRKMRNIAATAGPVGTAAIIAAGVTLGVAEVAIAGPVVGVALGAVALGGAAVAGVKAYKRHNKK